MVSPSASQGQRLVFGPTDITPSKIRYHVSLSNASQRRPKSHTTLIDRGANACIFGSDWKPVQFLDSTVDLSGIRNHTINDLRICTCAATVKTDRGPVILIANQGAHLNDYHTILSPQQLEHFGCQVFDKSSAVADVHPHLVTKERYRIPFVVRRGLVYMQARPYTDSEWTTLPHIHITSPATWNPAILDCKVPDNWWTRPTDDSYFKDSIVDDKGELSSDLLTPEYDLQEPRPQYAVH